MLPSPKTKPTPLRILRRLEKAVPLLRQADRNYRQRISGPLLDRIDIHVEVPLVDFKELTSAAAPGPRTDQIASSVILSKNIGRSLINTPKPEILE